MTERWTSSSRYSLVLRSTILAISFGMFLPSASGQQTETRTYKNSLVKLVDPAPLLNDHPEFVQPVIEDTRYEAPVLVDDEDANLTVRAWRFSYNARGIIEMPNNLRAKETAVVMVHPWGIDDGQGWDTPEPAGVADFCTPTKNHLAARHTSEVINPFIESLRSHVGCVMFSLPGSEDPIRKLVYRSVNSTPTAAQRAQGAKELSAKLKNFDYRGMPLPADFSLSTKTPVIDYFKQFPGLDAGAKYNNEGFWQQPIPVTRDITVHPDDIVIYDADGYGAMRDYLKKQGIRHVLLTGYATDMCFCKTTAGYDNLSQDFNVFLVGDATLATFPSNNTPRYATNAHISFAALNQLVTQVSWVKLSVAPFRDAVTKVRESWTTSKLQGTPVPPEPFRVVSAFPQLKFDLPTSLLELPGTNRLLVSEIGGRVFTFVKDAKTAKADLVLDTASVAGGTVSLFAAVVHPRFEDNHYVYLCLVHPGGKPHTRVSRYTMTSGPEPVLDPKSETVIITWPSGGHNAGCMRFGTDGMLYIATGDGSGPNPPDGLTTGQTVSDLLGSILRIDVDHPSADQQYSIPVDNPFVKHDGARPEIFGYGLRNPWKFGIDAKTGEVYVADNGWETWEMIHVVGSGTNCGWPVMEGRAKLRSEVPVGPTPITAPIRDHHHSEANSVIGGPIYRGDKLKSLHGEFVYGDYITGTIWSVGRSADGSFVGKTLVDTDLRITDFMESSAGQLYVVDYDLTGQIYELLPNEVEDRSADFPKLLSQTGIFGDISTLKPAPGVVAYDVTVPRWVDGAEAQRFVGVPGKETIQLAPHSAIRGMYPEGTVFAKHLSVPASEGHAARPLETQILQFQYGTWHPYSYLWNDQGTDAELVGSIGTAKSVQWPDTHNPGKMTERTWHSNAVNECKLCHNAGPGFVLGFVGNQLAGVISNDNPADQLESLLAQGVIASIPEAARSESHRLVNPHDETVDLNDRARSYLHGNCSMCHHKGGNAIVSFFMTRDLTFDQMMTNKSTNIGTFGMQHAKLVVPGDPYRSVMMYRMSKLGYARMPYIGSQVIDGHGVTLIDQWICSLPASAEAKKSDPMQAGTAQSLALASIASESTSKDSRNAAVRTLIGNTEGALALMSKIHDGQLKSDDRVMAVETVRNASSDIRGLFDDFVPESQRKKTLGRIFEPSLVLDQDGDALRGRLIFFSDAARCRACHHTDDAALSVGPTLKEISKKYVHESEMLQHILQPSLKVDDKFAAWAVVTTDGKVFAGLMQSQTDSEVVLRTADRQRVTLTRKDIEELQKSTRSLMPEGVLADLTSAEAADLLAFVRSLAEPSD